jgi:aminoglycoside N3'-acetyltransferase
MRVRIMSSKITASVKQTLRRKHKEVRLALLRTCCSFGRQDLLEAYRALQICSGDALFVHSSFNQFAGFTGKATDVNSSLQEAVGANGHVLMPTIPFSGTAVQYASEGRVFDVRRTPSQMGLLTELFRRQPGVLRSVHPTHPVAVAGVNAEAWISGHHLARTPCGSGTPYARLAEHRGKILFMGTDVGVMTFFHFIEEVLEPQMPFSPFTEEVYTLRSKDGEGHQLTTQTRLFNPTYSRKRNLHLLVRPLRQRKQWQQATVGRLKLILLKADDILLTCRDLADQGIYCYES